MRLRVPCLAAAVIGAASAGTQAPPLPPSSLAVWTGERWEEWWQSVTAPVEWTGPGEAMSRGLRWRRVGDGVEWSEARLAGRGEARRIRLIVARLDPRRVRFRLDTAWRDRGTRPGWSVNLPGDDALVAVNAGQFPHSLPWGWVMLDGREFLNPGPGPLSVGIAFDAAGSIRWIPPDALADRAVRQGAVVGFQSYPRLLDNGRIPPPLQARGENLDLAHRDARAAIGETRDNRILIALTRFDGLDGVLGFVPFGLTTPEMAAVMGALGAREAVMLDGGISSQLLIRAPDGTRRWRGLRPVPMGLVAVAR